MAVGKAYQVNRSSMIAGNVIHFNMHGSQEAEIRPFGLTMDAVVKFWEGKSCWQQPGLFFPRSAYELVGGIDEDLRYVMDYELICRLLPHCPVIYLGRSLAGFRLHSSSKTCTAAAYMKMESSRVSRRYWQMLRSVDRTSHDQYMARFLSRRIHELVHRRHLVQAARLLADAMRICPKESAGAILTRLVQWGYDEWKELRGGYPKAP